MEIKAFADKYRVRVRKDECGEMIIPGKRGHVYVHSYPGTGVYGAIYERDTPTAKGFGIKPLLTLVLEGSLTLKGEGDIEAIFLFDPERLDVVEVLLKVLRVSRRRIPSPELLERLRQMRDRNRSKVSDKPLVEGERRP